jgi:hypothetical protein
MLCSLFLFFMSRHADNLPPNSYSFEDFLTSLTQSAVCNCGWIQEERALRTYRHRAGSQLKGVGCMQGGKSQKCRSHALFYPGDNRVVPKASAQHSVCAGLLQQTPQCFSAFCIQLPLKRRLQPASVDMRTTDRMPGGNAVQVSNWC